MLAPQTPCRRPPLRFGESASAAKSRVCSEDPPSFITEVVAAESEGSGSFCSLMTVTRTGGGVRVGAGACWDLASRGVEEEVEEEVVQDDAFVLF